MKIESKSRVSGKLNWLRVLDKNGRLKHEVKDVPNILLNDIMAQGGIDNIGTLCFAYTSTAPNFIDLDGTWDQTSNTITRATGTGVFTSSPSKIGDELYWYDAGSDTGHRVHVTARASDTSITVSGPAKTITGGKLRLFSVNRSTGSTSSTNGSEQVASSSVELSNIVDAVAGTRVVTRRFNFSSTPSAYTLGSLIIDYARVVLPVPYDLEAEDQIQLEYSRQETVTGRVQDYELGAETIGLPSKFAIVSIVGDGTNVDVTFATATHFLAGDKLDLRNVTPKKFAVASASSTATTLTINTTAAHGLSVSDSVLIEDAALAGYNGTFTVSAVVDSDTFEITDGADPGAAGAGGTVRLSTPATYFDDLGLATIASMVSSSVARITSTITGPAADTAPLGGDPGVQVRLCRTNYSGPGAWKVSMSSSGYRFSEANAKPLVDDLTVQSPVVTGGVPHNSVTNTETIAYTNDWTAERLWSWNAGTGTGENRIKQFALGTNFNGTWYQITLATPAQKTEAMRLRATFGKQVQRTLDLTGLP